MGSVIVVDDPPVFDDLLRVVEVGEEMLVEALITQAAVEDFAVLHRPAGRDVMLLDRFSSCQANSAFEVNSVPLSLTIMRGQTRVSMIRSSSRAARKAIGLWLQTDQPAGPPLRART